MMKKVYVVAFAVAFTVGCQGVGSSPHQIVDKAGYIEIEVLVNDAGTREPLEGVWLYDRAVWILSGKKTDGDGAIGVTNEQGTLREWFYTLNGNADVVLVRSGYTPKYLLGIADSFHGGRVDMGIVSLERENQGEAPGKAGNV